MIRQAQAEYLRRLIFKLEELLPEMVDENDIQRAVTMRREMLWHWTRLTCSKWHGPGG
jgi:hypothetical protein